MDPARSAGTSQGRNSGPADPVPVTMIKMKMTKKEGWYLF